MKFGDVAKVYAESDLNRMRFRHGYAKAKRGIYKRCLEKFERNNITDITDFLHDTYALNREFSDHAYKPSIDHKARLTAYNVAQMEMMINTNGYVPDQIENFRSSLSTLGKLGLLDGHYVGKLTDEYMKKLLSLKEYDSLSKFQNYLRDLLLCAEKDKAAKPGT
jgi:hypothetical protein